MKMDKIAPTAISTMRAFIILHRFASRCECYIVTRACTGFDGGFEVVAAIHGPRPCKNGENLNINADNRLAFAA